MKDRYWNGKGVEQSKYDEMMAADWDDMMTKASKDDMHRYYRYYNDGDLPGWARTHWEWKKYEPYYYGFGQYSGKWVLNDAGEEELERRATEVILNEYKRFQKAIKH